MTTTYAMRGRQYAMEFPRDTEELRRLSWMIERNTRYAADALAVLAKGSDASGVFEVENDRYRVHNGRVVSAEELALDEYLADEDEPAPGRFLAKRARHGELVEFVLRRAPNGAGTVGVVVDGDDWGRILCSPERLAAPAGVLTHAVSATQGQGRIGLTAHEAQKIEAALFRAMDRRSA